MDAVLNYYDQKIVSNVKTNNVFPQQLMAMNFLAKLNKLPYSDGFPQVNLSYYNRFNKSKLSFSQVYSSHPETEDRIARLEALNAPVDNQQIGFAIDLIHNRIKLENELTQNMFANVNYSQIPVDQDDAAFELDFINQTKQNAYPELFNNFFDYRNPYIKHTETDFEKPVIRFEQGATELFSDENLSLIYDLSAIEADLATIDRIDCGLIDTKTFNYNGQKYTKVDCRRMLEYLRKEIEHKIKQLEDLDLKIFEYFRCEASELEQAEEYKKTANHYKLIADKFAAQQIIYADLVNSTSFMHTTTPFELIKKKITVVKKEEQKLKDCLVSIQNDEDYAEFLTPELQTRFSDFLKSNYKYFGVDLYFDAELNDLFAILADFAGITTNVHFKAKKELLDFQANLIAPILS